MKKMGIGDTFIISRTPPWAKRKQFTIKRATALGMAQTAGALTQQSKMVRAGIENLGVSDLDTRIANVVRICSGSTGLAKVKADVGTRRATLEVKARSLTERASAAGGRRALPAPGGGGGLY